MFNLRWMISHRESTSAKGGLAMVAEKCKIKKSEAISTKRHREEFAKSFEDQAAMLRRHPDVTNYSLADLLEKRAKELREQ